MGAALLSPWRGERGAEAAYVRAVGARCALWHCCYLVYQISAVIAVLGRALKEGRPHELPCLLLFSAPHALSSALLCGHFAGWLRLREPLAAATTGMRALLKLAAAVRLLPYAQVSPNYVGWGMDVMCEGVLPALFEQARAPLVLPLRALEGLATGLHYMRLQAAAGGGGSGGGMRGGLGGLGGAVEEEGPAAAGALLLYALSWTLGCGLLTVALDAVQRAQFRNEQQQEG
ncbi:hypothetical protein Agub_g11535, partial [Astrephomene gubernaculifera]